MPRQKTMKVVFAFRTTTDALIMERCARQNQASGRLIPIPTRISAGCGMAFCAPVEERQKLEQMVCREGIELEGVYELLL